MTVLSAIPAAFASRFDAVAHGASGDLLALKRQAWERFEARGLPGRKDEDWKDLNLAALEKAFSQGEIQSSPRIFKDGIIVTSEGGYLQEYKD